MQSTRAERPEVGARAPEASGPQPLASADLYVKGLAAAAGGFRVRVTDREAAARQVVDEIYLGSLEVTRADRVDEQPDAVRLDPLIGLGLPFPFIDHEPVLEAGAAAALHEHSQRRLLFVLFRQQL